MHKTNFRNLDLNLLRIFNALWEYRSITRAGQALGLSQPAVSHALRRLRDETSDLLFVRKDFGMQPTKRAIELCGPIKNALELLQTAFQSDQQFDPKLSSRTFRIAMTLASELYYLPRLINSIEKNEYRITISVSSPNTENVSYELRRGEIECYIGYNPSIVDDFYSDVLTEDEFVIVLRNNHPLLQKGIDICSLEMLHDIRYVYGERNTPGIGHIDRFFSELDIRPQISVTVSNLMSAPEIVKSTDLAVIFPKSLSHIFNVDGNFSILKIPYQFPEIYVRSFWNKSLSTDNGRVWFRQFIVDTLKE